MEECFTYEQYLRMSKKKLVNLCGYKNIKQMYKDSDGTEVFSKKKLARMLVKFN